MKSQLSMVVAAVLLTSIVMYIGTYWRSTPASINGYDSNVARPRPYVSQEVVAKGKAFLKKKDDLYINFAYSLPSLLSVDQRLISSLVVIRPR